MSQSVTAFMWTKGRFVLKKNMRLPNIRSTFWLHEFTFPSHESIESADPNHTFLKALSTVFLFLDSKDLRSRVDYHDWNRVCFILFTQVYTFSQPPPPPHPLHPDSCGQGLKAKQTPRNVVVIQYPEESNQLYTIDNSFQFDWLDRVMLTAKRSENLFPDAISLL